MTGHLLPQQVTVEPFLGSGAYGPVYGEPVTVAARVQYERKLVRNADGAEAVAEATIYTAPGVNLGGPGTRVTLPSGDQRTAVAIVEHVGRYEAQLVEVNVS